MYSASSNLSFGIRKVLTKLFKYTVIQFHRPSYSQFYISIRMYNEIFCRPNGVMLFGGDKCVSDEHFS